jgi:hypothetical protein
MKTFLIPRMAFTFWDIKNDKSDKFEHWPEVLKMDWFIEECWKNNYEDDIRQSIIYNLF